VNTQARRGPQPQAVVSDSYEHPAPVVARAASKMAFAGAKRVQPWSAYSVGRNWPRALLQRQTQRQTG